MIDARSQFRDAIRAAGLEPPEVIEVGKFHRFPGIGKRNGNTAGWCKLLDDGLGGCFGDWSSGLSGNWQAKRDKPFTAKEQAAFKRHVKEAKAQAEAERKANQAETAAKAVVLWNAAHPAADEHPYLVRKHIKAYGARLHGGALLIPLRDASSKLHSLQFIGSDGAKRFLSGGRTQGCYFSIGKPDSELCIVEGYATGASVHEATGYAVAVAFNDGNLEVVARALRKKFPRIKLILCADDDVTTQGNPGLTEAREAARSIGGYLAVPNFGENRPDKASDFNDLHRLCGLEAVRVAIEGAIFMGKATDNRMSELSTAQLVCGADIQPEPVSWLWAGWLAAGKVHVLAGAPGTGKTMIAVALAATLTVGGRWPDGSQAGLEQVLIWSGEDDPADTLVPRLLACKADLNRIHFVKDVINGEKTRPFDPARDMAALTQAIANMDRSPKLLIVDPIVSAVAADSHKNGEVRRALQPLVEFAMIHRCAVLGISHFTKGTAGRDPVERVTGSLAFGALARLVMVATKSADGEEHNSRRLLARAKSNIGPDAGGFHYDLEPVEIDGHPGICTTRLFWGEGVQGAARDLLAQTETESDSDAQSALEDAKEFLTELLSNGPVLAKEVFSEAKQAGYARQTIYRAKQALGIKSVKDRFDGGWKWVLPTKMTKIAEDDHSKWLDTFEPLDHLGPASDSQFCNVDDDFEVF